MFQLPLLGSATPSSGKLPGLDRADPCVGLQALLQGADDLSNVFSGELQAMLMQLTPQLLQRLEELVSGGMTLPQAAKSLLSEAGTAGGTASFAELFQGGLPTAGDTKLVPAGLAREEITAAHTGAAETPAVRLPGTIELLQMLASPAAAPSAAAPLLTATGAMVSQLPPQLAANLLDMGVPQQVGGKGWDGAIADRVIWMVQGEQQFAKLKLNPPNLGPLEVRVSVSQDQASVSFMAQHAMVREALEAALPRLREMFEQQSMQLVRADVSDPGAQRGDAAHDSSGQAHAAGGRWGNTADTGQDPLEDAAKVSAGLAKGLIDLFA